MRWTFSTAVLVVGCALFTPPSRAADPLAEDEQTLRDAKVGVDGPALLAHLRKRFLTDADADRVKALIQKLGNAEFEVREKAATALVEFKRPAVRLLQHALADPDVEIARRVEVCLEQILSDKESDSDAVDAAVVRLLAARRPPGTAEIFLSYLPCAADGLVVEDVRTALTAAAKANAADVRTLTTALTDKNPERRSAAACALIRANAGSREAAAKLLTDEDLQVRLAVALELTCAREKAAVPVLIDLLGQLPLADLWPAEDVLLRLADDKGPRVELGVDADGRKACRDAWAKWWADRAERVEMARLGEGRLLGHTMMIELDNGRLFEVDGRGRLIWQIVGLNLPLDAQMLAGGTVLIAEYQANRVTERDRRGRIVWELALTEGPTVAQRLPNGNTFVATQHELIEFTPKKERVFAYRRPGIERFTKAMKLANGDVACLTDGQQFVRIDKGKEETHTFRLEASTFGGRIDVLANGHVLAPQLSGNKVLEFDGDGKIVWQAAFNQPVAAVRLANGHTLITSIGQKRAVEVDRDGREVWEYSSNTRVTRAWRR